jgi:hypothetical protein
VKFRWPFTTQPEFTNVPKQEQKRLWRCCWWRAVRGWPLMLEVLVVVAAGVAGPLYILPAIKAAVPGRKLQLVLTGLAPPLLGLTVGTGLFQFTWRRALPHIRAELLAAGRCPGCGYSLTGNASGTCPECGTPVTVAKGVTP